MYVRVCLPVCVYLCVSYCLLKQENSRILLKRKNIYINLPEGIGQYIYLLFFSIYRKKDVILFFLSVIITGLLFVSIGHMFYI